MNSPVVLFEAVCSDTDSCTIHSRSPSLRIRSKRRLDRSGLGSLTEGPVLRSPSNAFPPRARALRALWRAPTGESRPEKAVTTTGAFGPRASARLVPRAGAARRRRLVQILDRPRSGSETSASRVTRRPEGPRGPTRTKDPDRPPQSGLIQ